MPRVRVTNYHRGDDGARREPGQVLQVSGEEARRRGRDGQLKPAPADPPKRPAPTAAKEPPAPAPTPRPASKKAPASGGGEASAEDKDRAKS